MRSGEAMTRKQFRDLVKDIPRDDLVEFMGFFLVLAPDSFKPEYFLAECYSAASRIAQELIEKQKQKGEFGTAGGVPSPSGARH